MRDLQEASRVALVASCDAQNVSCTGHVDDAEMASVLRALGALRIEARRVASGDATQRLDDSNVADLRVELVQRVAELETVKREKDQLWRWCEAEVERHGHEAARLRSANDELWNWAQAELARYPNRGGRRSYAARLFARLRPRVRRFRDTVGADAVGVARIGEPT